MKVLITGGAGMIGSHCAEYFLKLKYKVVIIDNLMRSKIFRSDKKSVEYNWRYLKSLKNIKLYKKDIRNSDEMLRIFKREKPDVVIHTAGQPGVRYSLENPLDDCSINTNGTINVLEAMRKTNPKGTFIYCSTNKVYGDNVNKIPIKMIKFRYEFKNVKGVSEKFNIDLTGHTPYGVSKLAGDLYAQDYAHAYNMKTGIFRMSCIYCTRQFGFEDQGWLAWFAIRNFLKKPITIYGDGKQIRDILWAEDLAKAFHSFIESPFQSEVFNIGGGESNTISLLELCDLLSKTTGNNIKIKFNDWRKFDQKVYVSDISKVKRLLKWKPTVTPKAGIKKLLSWIESNKNLFNN